MSFLDLGGAKMLSDGGKRSAGLLLRGGCQGFLPATMNVALNYFKRKVEEK